ncbi:Glycine betaine/proline transport system permease protein/glycine betaine/proline transport system substrate-binding protein OS=Ureibacillus acetophenoni OX=614649 GN=SAMN05877842_11181 PE=3 SV=1 [Ureibacillus acetophenoni]
MDWLTDTFAGFFDVIKESGKFSMERVTDILEWIPPILFILIIAVIAFFATKRKFGLAIFSIVGLLFIYNQGLWEELMNTITLVLFASILANYWDSFRYSNV